MTKFIENLQTALSPSRSIAEANQRLLSFLRNQNLPNAYVAGIMTSDGPTYVDRNLANLRAYTQLVRTKRPDLNIFCSPEVFVDIWEFLRKNNTTEEQYGDFWDQIILRGNIRELFLTPRWRESRGAVREVATAKNIPGLVIREVDLCNL